MNRGSIVITTLVGYEADFRMSERTLRSAESHCARNLRADGREMSLELALDRESEKRVFTHGDP